MELALLLGVVAASLTYLLVQMMWLRWIVQIRPKVQYSLEPVTRLGDERWLDGIGKDGWTIAHVQDDVVIFSRKVYD